MNTILDGNRSASNKAGHWNGDWGLRWARAKKKALSTLGHHVFRGTDAFFGGQSRIPTDAVLPNETFAWTGALSASYDAIRQEADALLRHRELLPTFQDISPDQSRISPDRKWRIFVLKGFGRASEPNRALCPETARVLDCIPDLETAFFSVLAPGKHVPQHRGVSRGFVRAHLGVRVPRDAERCRMQVGDAHVVWREGEVVLFDDTQPHEVWNETAEERVVLLIDVRRPMRPAGRALLASLMAILAQTPFVKHAVRNELAWEQGVGTELRRRIQQSSPRPDHPTIRPQR